jgi:L-lactate dehydrogenase complex protein LldF
MSRTEFRERIRASLANKTLQIALDANAERRVTGQVAAFASLPDWRERRQQAHAIRADVIEHLEEYLEKFARNAEKNKIIVHRAKDASEAIKIVLQIIEDSPRSPHTSPGTPHSGARYQGRYTKESVGHPQDEKVLVAKSKSMVTEEIHLNHALEAQGIRVVETDLGEYIVQLRGEKPAHIITPAVHLRRDDVGKLFHEKLGIPYTEDIPTLTAAARQVLRDVFLRADVGISGVNFGIAETGGVCIVSNEGNARMVTTLPPVHIAVMGMERLVRGLDDLALMLSLLPRSATTQKLSVYTQLIHAPMPNQQRHLILLDNGRTQLRNSPLKESLYCIRCGACLNACPVFREIGGHGYHSVYPGPIGSVISAGFFGSDFVPLAQASSLCGACKEACPVDIDLPNLLTRVRAGQSPISSNHASRSVNRDGGLSSVSKLFLRMYSFLSGSPRLFALSQKLAALGTGLVSPFSDYVQLPAFTGWGYSKDLPRFATSPFRERFAELQEAGTQVDRYASRQVHIEEGKNKPKPLDRKALVSQFIEELTKVNGKVTRVDQNELTRNVIDFLKARGIDRIHLEPNLLEESVMQQAGIVISHEPDPSIRVGVTKAICGLADTGSVLIVDQEGNPLQASLLPQTHVAVLCVSDLLPSLENALTLPIVHQSRATVVVTGPSRTADIEMSLTIGMHGPGEVHVFLVHTIC